MAIIVDNFSGTPFEGKGEAFQVDYAGRSDGQPVFIGWAAPGSATSDPVWKITKFTYDGGGNVLTRLWAVNGTGKAFFDQVWDSHTTLTYT